MDTSQQNSPCFQPSYAICNIHWEIYNIHWEISDIFQTHFCMALCWVLQNNL